MTEIAKATRSRGRPIGSTKFDEQDDAELRRFAKMQLQLGKLQLAPFLRKRGYLEKDIRRAHARWRKEKDRYLAHAKLAADATSPQSMWDFVVSGVEALYRLGELIAPTAQLVAESWERAKRRAAARGALGYDASTPLDFADEKHVRVELLRLESTVGRQQVPEALYTKEFGELPHSLQLYYTSLLLHTLSIQAAEREATGASQP